MTDAHNHLQDCRFDGIREQIIAEMIDRGVTRCVVNGTSPTDWPRVAELSEQHPNLIIPSFGLHPWHQPSGDWLGQLVHYLDTVPNACMGECGLDRWIKGYDMDEQSKAFIAQLDLAAERNSPLTIHCLKAWGHLVHVLDRHPLPKRGFLLHSYGGSAELVPRLVELGAYFSFSGYFLHERKQHMRDVFKCVPPDRLLIETDSPDMLPPDLAIAYPLQGGLNHPANLLGIAHEASKFLDTSYVEENFAQLFQVSKMHPADVSSQLGTIEVDFG